VWHTHLIKDDRALFQHSKRNGFSTLTKHERYRDDCDSDFKNVPETISARTMRTVCFYLKVARNIRIRHVRELQHKVAFHTVWNDRYVFYVGVCL
jgi:hypothetical protein